MRQFEDAVGEMHSCTAKAAVKLAGCSLRVGECEVAGLLLERAVRFYGEGGWEGEEGRVRGWMGLLEGVGGERWLGEGGMGEGDRGVESEFDEMIVCWAR